MSFGAEDRRRISAVICKMGGGQRVFCNPPYDKGITQFLERARDADIAVFLLPVRTDTKWFHNLILPFATEIRFVKGRLKFGDAKKAAPFPSMIVIFSNAPTPAQSGPDSAP